jgi:hypothetical protein
MVRVPRGMTNQRYRWEVPQKGHDRDEPRQGVRESWRERV